MYTKNQFINQAIAEGAVITFLGLPKEAIENLSSYGIRVLLHGRSGIEQNVAPGDLVFLCELVRERAVRISGIQEVRNNGGVPNFMKVPMEKEAIRQKLGL
jgi:hypothetical protein